MLEAAAHPSRTARNHLRDDRRRGAGAPQPRRRAVAARRARRCGRPALRRVLPRHAPAARPRRRRSWAIRPCSSSTSPPTASTRRASAGCATSSARWPPKGARSCCPVTCWRRWPRRSTTSSSSAHGHVVAHAPLSQLTEGGATKVRLLAAQPDALEAALLEHGLVASDREGDAISVSGRRSATSRGSPSTTAFSCTSSRRRLRASRTRSSGSPSKQRRHSDDRSRPRTARRAAHPAQHVPWSRGSSSRWWRSFTGVTMHEAGSADLRTESDLRDPIVGRRGHHGRHHHGGLRGDARWPASTATRRSPSGFSQPPGALASSSPRSSSTGRSRQS